MKTRTQVLELASLREYDLVIIGGGIVGAGVAQEAACRGLSVILIDRDDFASGTSSKTTKLIHGGLRYLEQCRFKLTQELCEERALLEHLAPHLVHDFSFVLPLMKKNPFMGFKASLGLTIYDLLTMTVAGGQPHKLLSPKEVLESAPALSNLSLMGGLKFHDAVTDDSRLVLTVIKSACANGAHAINYLEATSFGIEDNIVRAVNCRDRYSGKEIQLRCKACVNATGVWSDKIMRLVDPQWNNHVLPAKGIHIMIPPSAFETNTALFLPTTDKRYVFVVPWQRSLMIGTTDSAYDGNLDTPLANGDEIDYLLSVVNQYNGQRSINRSDITAAWAGLRPLAHNVVNNNQSQSDAISNGKQTDKINTSKISREHEILQGPGGIIMLIGGKLTNYRLMAGQVINRVLAKFPALANAESKLSRTKRLMLGGWTDKQDFLTTTSAISARARKLAVEPATIDHLLATYGKDAQNVLDIVEEAPEFNTRICPDFPPIMAEIPFSVQEEMAVSLEDFLARRVRLGMLHHKQCLEAAPKVAFIMQKLLGWDDTRVEAELTAFSNSLQSFEPAREQPTDLALQQT